jgi:hypothetical protein
MTHAIRFHKTGGPEVLVWEEVSLGKPGPGEARIRHTAVGLNFVDIYNRSGLYPAQLPSGLGGEAAGVVEEVGSGVTDLKPGDRVAYGAAPIGAYAEARLIPADRLLLPISSSSTPPSTRWMKPSRPPGPWRSWETASRPLVPQPRFARWPAPGRVSLMPPENWCFRVSTTPMFIS